MAETKRARIEEARGYQIVIKLSVFGETVVLCTPRNWNKYYKQQDAIIFCAASF